VQQAKAVHRVLRGLVEHVAGSPDLLPAPSAEAAGWPAPSSPEALRAAVTYVAGMTDRYAVARAERWLGPDVTAVGLGVV
jgi:dGTPase